MQIILTVVFDSRTTASLQAVELLESLVCLLIDTEQSSNTSADAFIAIGEDDGRAEVGEKNKENRQQCDVRFFYDAVLTMNQRKQAVWEVC